MSGNIFNEVSYDKKSPSERPALRRSPDRPDHVKRVHAAFGLIGLLVAIGVAVYAYSASSSIALALVLFLVVQGYISRGLGDVATDPKKGKRFVYFTLQPVLTVGVLVLTYQWWGIMWLAALLGLVIGGMLWATLGTLIFPKIAEEEAEDTKGRWKEAMP